MNLSSVFGPQRPATPEHGRLGDTGIVALPGRANAGLVTALTRSRQRPVVP